MRYFLEGGNVGHGGFYDFVKITDKNTEKSNRTEPVTEKKLYQFVDGTYKPQ